MAENEHQDEQEQPDDESRFTLMKVDGPLTDEEIDGFFQALGIDPATVPKDDEDAKRRERLGLPINQLLEDDLSGEQG
jgi:hypothetical protein